MSWIEPDPDKRITNSDEQEVAVNQSTREEGGYDEPASTRQPESASPSEPVKGSDERVPEGKGRSSRKRKIN